MPSCEATEFRLTMSSLSDVLSNPDLLTFVQTIGYSRSGVITISNTRGGLEIEQTNCCKKKGKMRFWQQLVSDYFFHVSRVVASSSLLHPLLKEPCYHFYGRGFFDHFFSNSKNTCRNSELAFWLSSENCWVRLRFRPD